jgi:hypothetical protein
MVKKYALDFGKKEKVLNYACQTYQLSRPNKVGPVMALIRECQPKTFEEWEAWYFEHAYTKGRSGQAFKITRASLDELGERLYEKITQVVIPEWTEAFRQITLEDCIAYIYNLTIQRTFDGYLREKSVVNDYLAKHFPEVKFEESAAELDHAGDIDYLGWVGAQAFGIQIKPVTARSNFGNYSISDRMRASFQDFTDRFGGKVFIVFSLDGEVAHPTVLGEIAEEIKRLKKK